MTVMATSASDTISTANNQLEGNLTSVNPDDSQGSRAGTGRTRPRTGHRQDAKPEPPITNFNLTSAITRPTAPCSPNLPGTVGTRGGVAAPQAEHHRKHKPAETVKISQGSPGNVVPNGPIRPPREGLRAPLAGCEKTMAGIYVPHPGV